MTEAKTILITGSTDGIGLETAQKLAAEGHRVLLHGRNQAKLDRVAEEMSSPTGERPDGYIADLTDLAQVRAMADRILADHDRLDVLINNAGVYVAPAPAVRDGLDVRFLVNTIAPYLLTERLLSVLGPTSRVINLSSAAQASVDLDAMAGQVTLGDGPAYAQSKLALTMWSRAMGLDRADDGPVVVSVNPGSLLDTKMVREAFGRARADVGVGSDILVRAALSEEFASATGKYFDNDAGRFAQPHPDALDPQLCAQVVELIESILATP